MVGDRKLIVRVDRTELSKNMVRGLAAYRELLIAHPEWRGKVMLETGIGDLKTAIRGGPAAVLRSRTPAMVTQEFWAMLCVYQAIRDLISYAAPSGLDPGRISFKRALEAAWDSVPRGLSPPGRLTRALEHLSGELTRSPITSTSPGPAGPPQEPASAAAQAATPAARTPTRHPPRSATPSPCTRSASQPSFHLSGSRGALPRNK